MKKFIFNSLIVSILIAITPITSKAATATVAVGAGVMTNIVTLANGSLKVSKLTLTSQLTNQVSVQVIDTYTNWFLYTNAPYTNILTYATNYVSVWTNYYGATNTVTNKGSLIDVTNSVAGTTNAFPVRAVVSTLTNTTTTIDNLNAVFNDGIWVTNSGSGTAQVTITYQQ